MKIGNWPDRDQTLWRSALAPTDPFEPVGGARAAHKAISNRKTEKGYGRWLTWLAAVGNLRVGNEPHRRITPDRVKAYAAHLQQIGNGSQTVLARLQELGEVATVFAPAADWSFIRRMAARVRVGAKPVRNKRANLAMTDELVGLGLNLMSTASSQSTPRLAALAFRDGLLIALLALRPLRRKNLASLALDMTVVRCDDGWSIRIPALETKTNTAIEAPWPNILLGPLEQYLAVHRLHLVTLKGRWAAPAGQALWISSNGSPMTQMALYDTIRHRTKAGLDKVVNPHLFRDAAATTLAIADPACVRLAASILGHRSFATTERHYQQATSIEAHRQYAAFLDGLRGCGDPCTVPVSNEEGDA